MITLPQSYFPFKRLLWQVFLLSFLYTDPPGIDRYHRYDYHCTHCLRDLSDQKVDFPIDLLPSLLEQARPFGSRHVGFTGGEPRLHPHFAEIVEMAAQAGYTWHFNSNGSRSEPYLSLIDRFRDQFTGVTFNIDAATAEMHDAIRRKPGAFERILASARCYREAGLSLYINSVLSALNQVQMPDLLRLAEELGACGINFCSNLNFTKAAFNARGEMVFCCDTRGYSAVVGVGILLSGGGVALGQRGGGLLRSLSAGGENGGAKRSSG